MVVNALQERAPAWLTSRGDDADVGVVCQCSLARNLADYPFPAQCSDDERHQVEDRILGVLDNLNLLSQGTYYSLPDLDPLGQRFLAERRFCAHDLIGATGPRGVFVLEDQSMSITVNGLDHLCFRVTASGMQFQEAWAQLNLVDDTLTGALDYAYHDRLGFLTASLEAVGTGLKTSAVIHLPALAFSNRIGEGLALAKKERLRLEGARSGAGRKPQEASLNQAFYTGAAGPLCREINEAEGDLYVLGNQETLGLSEEEIAFHVRFVAQELAKRERSAREQLLREDVPLIEDRVGRARGAATGARLLEFGEGVDLLSSLRLGVAAGLIAGLDLKAMNTLLLLSQGAHLEMGLDRLGDMVTLSIARADLFRRTLADG